MAYATLAEVKEFLGITASTYDAVLTSLLTRAQAEIDAYTHRTFEAGSDTTRKLDAIENVDMQGRMLLLDEDLAQITSVTNGDGTTVAAANYVTEPRNETPYWALTLKTAASLSWTYNDSPEDAISIAGRWAYSVTVPADIKDITIQLVAHWHSDRTAMGVQRERVPYYDVTYAADDVASGLPASIKARLDKYVEVRW